MSKRIVFDCDDVLFNFNEQMCEWHNRAYGTSYGIQDIRSYDLGRVFGCSSSEAMDRVMEFHETPDFSKIKPLPGVRESISHLKQRGYKMDVATARAIEMRKKTLEAIDKYFPGVFDEIFVLGDFGKEDNPNKRKKSQVCIERGASAIVEDAAHHALDCANTGINVVLMKKPWNHGYEPSARIKSVQTVGSMVRQILYFSNGVAA